MLYNLDSVLKTSTIFYKNMYRYILMNLNWLVSSIMKLYTLVAHQNQTILNKLSYTWYDHNLSKSNHYK